MNLAKAVAYFPKAADKGDERALYMMGSITLQGLAGVAQDDGAAFRFFSKAGNSGMGPRKSRLPTCTLMGGACRRTLSLQLCG